MDHPEKYPEVKETITDTITQAIQFAIHNAFPNLGEIKHIIVPGKNTDYQFNQTFSLAKELNLEPDSVANILHEKFSLIPEISDVEIINISKKIFIVFNIAKKYLDKTINNMYATIIKSGFSLPVRQVDPGCKSGFSLQNTQSIGKNVIIDFSSPNIAKEMHVGHLRSTIIGESLCRIHEFYGYNVKRINHVGDWGTQFGMLIAYIKKYNLTQYTISDLMQMYKQSRKIFEEDEEFNQQAHIETVALQQGVPENILIWKNICDISMESFNSIYSYLDTHAEVRGESFYQNHMIELVKELDAKFKNDNGMKVYFPQGFTVPLIIVKSDGGFTYDTSDIAAIKYRRQIDKADEIIYVVDSGQQLHFQQVFQTAFELGFVDSIDRLKHAGFGLVLGADGKKLKTRSGETIKLQDLLDQAFEHAKVITKNLSQERHPDWDEEMINKVAKKISINCIKYSDLSNPRQNNYKFSFEKMLNLKGNTGVYLMYAMARCKAILKKIPDFDKNFNKILSGPIIIDTIDSRNLVIKLAKYQETINLAIQELAPHYLCNYLYDLVGILTKYYDNNRCIEFSSSGEILQINEHRIRLIYLVKIVIQKLFDLIGLEDIDQI